MKILKYAAVLILFLAMSMSTFAQNVLDGVYVKENYKTRKVIPYTHLREADVMWAKRVWRVIDLREKSNQVFYFPLQPTNDRKALIDVIKNGLKAGKTAYGNPLADEEFKVPMTKSEIENLFVRIDTSYQEDLATGQMVPIPVKSEIGAEDVKQYLIKEDWFFDKQRSVMDVRIIGICPLRESKSESGEVRGYSRMFWLYFPEWRPVFANAEVYNRHNDSERRTYEDIFWKRQFSSFVFKESNVYDRSIPEYKGGFTLDALLEAERVKEDIFMLEHDMWHF
jgi:gliding motility associated protien GldN